MQVRAKLKIPGDFHARCCFLFGICQIRAQYVATVSKKINFLGNSGENPPVWESKHVVSGANSESLARPWKPQRRNDEPDLTIP